MRSRCLVLIALTLLIAGCGTSAPAQRSVAGVEATLRAIRADVSAGRFNDACNRYLTASAIKALLTVVGGKDCAHLLAQVHAGGGNIGPAAHPRVDVYGNYATVSGPAGGSLVFLYVDGNWKIASPNGPRSGSARIYRIPSGAMEPTLAIGDKIFIVPPASMPHVGDIVVFHPPLEAQQQRCGVASPHGAACSTAEARSSTTRFVKRIVAGPGDVISIVNGHVVRNGAREPDPYIKPCVLVGECNYPTPIKIPADHWFLLGDNRGESDDSRFWGSVPTSWIVGVMHN